MLRADGLTKAFKERQVVANFSLQVEQGQTIGLLGPNGAGKTTCFYMVVGLIACDQGSIRLDDQDITHLPMNERARLGIGYLPQETSIFRKLSVYNNVMAILEMRQDLSRAERADEAERLMAELQVSHLARQLGISLSGGEKRRVEIARALAANPRFILLDEPFAGVDPISIGEIKSIIAHLKARGIGVLVTDHHVRETLDICDFAYIINQGSVLAEGTPADVLANQSVREVYLGSDFQM